MSQKKIFVVFDHLSSALHKFIITKQHEGYDCVVLTLGVSHFDARSFLPSGVELLECDENKYRELKNEAFDYYVKLPWLIRETENYKNEGENYWLLAHTEKTFWRSALPFRLYCLNLFKYHISKIDLPIQFFIQDISLLQSLKKENGSISVLKHVIKSYKSLLLECLKLFIKLVILKKSQIAKQKLVGSHKNLLISMYPDWFFVNSKGESKETFFMDSIAPTQGSNWDILLFIHSWKDLKKALNKDLMGLKNINCVFVDSLNKFSDLCCLISPFFLLKIFKKIKGIAAWENIFHFKGTDVTKLVKQDILRSYTNGAYYANLLAKTAIDRFKWAPYTNAFFRYECQPFENIFLKFKKQINFWGFQHSVFSDDYLNYIFPHDIFKKDKDHSPFYPQNILYTGDLVQKKFLSAGFENVNYFPVGAARFSKVFHYRNKYEPAKLKLELDIKINEKMIFMPISQLLEENITLIKLLCSVLNQFTQKFIVIVKINPNKKHDLVFIRAINDAFEVINMTHEVRVITDDPRYYELILAADVLYLTGASAAAEALFLDRPVMIFDAPELISHNPMTSYDKVFMKVKDQSSLYQALSNVINGDIQIDLNEKKKLFNDIFANVIENSANNFKKIIKDAENECK